MQGELLWRKPSRKAVLLLYLAKDGVANFVCLKEKGQVLIL